MKKVPSSPAYEDFQKSILQLLEGLPYDLNAGLRADRNLKKLTIQSFRASANSEYKFFLDNTRNFEVTSEHLKFLLNAGVSIEILPPRSK